MNINFENDNLVSEDINENVDFFTKNIISSAKISIPKSSPQLHKKSVSWWNEEIKMLIFLKVNCLRKYKRTGKLEHFVEFLKSKSKVRRVIREEKRKTWINFLETINSKTPSSMIFDKIRQLSGKYRSSVVKILKENDQLITDSRKICECLANSFENISSSSNYSKNFINYKNQIERDTLIIPLNNDESYNHPITIEELLQTLAECKGSSPGPDEIHYEMIQNLCINGKNFLIKIFNQIWLNHVFPENWKRSIMIAVLKPGKDPRIPTNYRPISLTNCLCKVLERIINKRLVWFLEEGNCFSDFQSGFRKNRCTLDNLLFLEHHIMKTFCEKKYLVSIFFDIEKAYDTTWRRYIIAELIRMGLKGNLVFFIKNFFSERFFKIGNGNNFSSERKMENGIVQGSIISVTCFLIVINTIFQIIDLPVKKIMFADDLAIFVDGNSFEDIRHKLQLSLYKLEEWSNKSGLRFSETKTVAMCFTRKYLVPTFPDLFLNGIKIKFAEQHKFLGMFLDPKLKWVTHLKYIKSKAARNLNLIKMLSQHKIGSDR